jgi:hypothetical protein
VRPTQPEPYSRPQRWAVLRQHCWNSGEFPVPRITDADRDFNQAEEIGYEIRGPTDLDFGIWDSPGNGSWIRVWLSSLQSGVSALTESLSSALSSSRIRVGKISRRALAPVIADSTGTNARRLALNLSFDKALLPCQRQDFGCGNAGLSALTSVFPCVTAANAERLTPDFGVDKALGTRNAGPCFPQSKLMGADGRFRQVWLRPPRATQSRRRFQPNPRLPRRRQRPLSRRGGG